MKTSLPFPGLRTLLIFATLMASYHLTFRQYLPVANGPMGHDYVLTIGGFLDGFLWFKNNGIFSAPWFTPSFCGGQPFFADPQSAYYSIPQLLTFFLGPVQAVYFSFLLFAGIGFWGMYLFSVKIIKLDTAGAIVTATAFMFNGFYAHRMIVGHYGYQSFMLVPLIAYLLLFDNEKPPQQGRGIILSIPAGTLIAYWFHSGLTTLIIPAALSIVTLACLVLLKQNWRAFKIFVTRGGLATLIALGLCASKLNANLSMMKGVPRDYYPLPGLENWPDILTFAFKSLVYSSEHVFRWVTPLWKNMQWSAMPHELAYGLTPVVMVAIIIGLTRALLLLQEQGWGHWSSREKYATFFVLFALITILALPLLLLYYTPEWNAVLKAIPLVGSTTSPFRWLIIYIPLICVLAGISCTSAGKFKQALAGLCVIGVPLLNALENRDYYDSQMAFDPAPYTEFYGMVKDGSIQPHITAIADPHTDDGQILIDNSQFIKGFSPIRCYNPLFGYRQEKLVTNSLTAGPTKLEVTAGRLNMHNPACLVFPHENSCNRWDNFKTTESNKLDEFTGYHPFQFEKDTRQKIADWLTTLTMFAFLLLLPTVGFLLFRRKTNET